jgi:hypothetical protein
MTNHPHKYEKETNHPGQVTTPRRPTKSTKNKEGQPKNKNKKSPCLFKHKVSNFVFSYQPLCHLLLYDNNDVCLIRYTLGVGEEFVGGVY